MCFDLAKEMPNYDYWVAKTFILLADNYVKLKDTFQAKATLQSIIDNYKGNDDILPLAQQKLQILSPGKVVQKPDSTQETKPDNKQEMKPDSKQEIKPDSTQEMKPDTTQLKKPENKG